MNIGIVTTWFERGAAYVSKQYEELLEDNHNVFIYARGEEYAIGNSKWDKKNVHWGTRYKIPVAKYIDKYDFRQWLIDNKIESVLFNEQTWYQSILICNELGIKTGAYIDYYTERSLELFNGYDFLICNTKRHYSAFSWHPQCYYIPWGTDLNLFKPKSIQKKEDKLIFFHSAGMNPFRKGTDFVIQAFYEICRSNNNVKLIIHTQVNIYKFFPALDNKIKELIKDKNLEIIEKTITAPGLYYLGDVYVYPSRIEGIGLSIAEALACGLPVITSDVQPMNEWIESPSQAVDIKKLYCRKDAYYWPVCEVNIQSLIEKMEWFIANKNKIKKYKQDTRTYAESNLSWITNKELIDKIFNNSKKLSLSKEIKEKINEYDNRTFYYITKFPKIYSILYTLYKRLKTKI